MEKYYTPKIEEFHVGFEYEVFEDFDSLPEKSWHKFIYGDPGTNDEDMGCPSESVKCRVKYLDESDIFILGWDPISNYYRLKNYTLLFMPETSEVEIKIIHANRREISVRFFGIIKNKAELKRLMVQFSILE